MAGASHAWPLLAEWTIHRSQDFEGHFPGHTVLPGAYVLDGIVQRIEQACGRPVRSVQSAKFAAVLEPGATLHIHAQLDAAQVRFAAVQCDITALSGVLQLAPAP